MPAIIITHPHAQTAVLLAAFNGQHRDHARRELFLSGCPRSLYTLACTLRAAKLMEEIESMTPAISKTA